MINGTQLFELSRVLSGTALANRHQFHVDVYDVLNATGCLLLRLPVWFGASRIKLNSPSYIILVRLL